MAHGRPSNLARLLIPTTREISQLESFKLREVPGAFVNLTQYTVSSQIAAILSYGPRFMLPQHASAHAFFNDFGQLHSYLENVYGTLDPSQIFLELFHKHHQELEALFNANTMSNIERALHATSSEVVEFFRDHPDTCIVQSDKGKKTCLMLKKDYMAKLSAYIDQCLLRGVYVHPIPRVIHEAVAAFKQLRTAIMAAVNTGAASLPPRLLERLNSFNPSNLEIPRLYGTVKCHKPDTPMRPICTTLRWMSRPIQQLLLHIFKDLFNDKLCSQNVTNIDHVARDITRLKLRKGFVFVKFDVRDMYGSMDKRKIEKLVRLLLNSPEIRHLLPLSPDLLLRMLHFSLDTSCILTFNGATYKQLKGLPQGACDSGFLATLYLDTLLQVHHEELFGVTRVASWWKYMDDILLYMPSKYIQHFHTTFEKITELELEMEGEEVVEGGGPLAQLGVLTTMSFLDLRINRSCCDTQSFSICRYIKPTTSLRMIHALSSTVTAYKLNTIRSGVRQILCRTSTSLLRYDLQQYYEQALCNAYPPALLDHLFEGVLRTESSYLRNGGSSYDVTGRLAQERREIIDTILLDYPTGGPSMLEAIRSEYVAISANSRCVFPYRSIEFSRLIRLGCAYGGMSMPVYSRADQTGAFSQFFANYTLGRLATSVECDPRVFNVGMVTCSTCNMIFLVSGRSRLDHLLQQELSRTGSALYRHQEIFLHHISPVVRSLRPIRGVDAAYLQTVYAAIFNSMGASCSDPILLSRVPIFVRGLLGYMQGLGVLHELVPQPIPRLRICLPLERPLARIIHMGLPELEAPPPTISSNLTPNELVSSSTDDVANVTPKTGSTDNHKATNPNPDEAIPTPSDTTVVHD